MPSITEARDELAELINRVHYGGERVTLERRGKPVAVLISSDDLALLEALEDEADARAYDEDKAEDDGTRFSLEEVKAEHEALKAQGR